VKREQEETPGSENPQLRGALSLALAKVAQSDKLAAEIESLLSGRGYDGETISAVLELMHKRRVLDDRRTIINTLERYSGRRAQGLEKIRAELIERGAPEDIVDEVLAGSAPDERVRAVHLLRSRSFAAGDAAKAGRFLLSRGFDEDLVHSVVEEHFDLE
jgi:regulatory protein